MTHLDPKTRQPHFVLKVGSHILLQFLAATFCCSGFAQEFAPDFRQLQKAPDVLGAQETYKSGVDGSQSDQFQLNSFFSVKKYESSLHKGSLRYKTLNLEKVAGRESMALAEAQTGYTYAEDLGDNKSRGIFTSIGSASDTLFHSEKEIVISATGFYSRPVEGSDGKKRIYYFLNYSNNRTFMNNIPLPGVGFGYNPDETFNLVLGVPFINLKWKVDPKWSYSLVYFFPSQLRNEIAYTIMGPIAIFFNADWTQQAFYLKNRGDDKERFFYDEKKVGLGLKSPLTKTLMAEIETSYLYDRKSYMTKSLLDSPDAVVHYSDSYGLSLKLNFFL